jgi:nucleoside-diphosphate-sugar epimerase
MTVLLTGATGFVGSHLARRLVADGEQVHAIVRPRSDCSRLPDDVVAHVHDGAIDGLCAVLASVQPDLVFHIAGRFIERHAPGDIAGLIAANVTFAAELTEAMLRAGSTRLVIASTSWQHFDGAAYSPMNLYAATKQAVETMLRYYVDAEGLRVIALKLYDTYGPDDKRNKIWSRLARMPQDSAPLSMSPGGQLIDLVHVDDTVAAFLVAGQRLRDDLVADMEDYAVCTGDLRSLRDIVALIAQTIERPIPIEWGGRPYRPREVMRPWTKGARLPGWQPRIRLEDGIRSILDADV